MEKQPENNLDKITIRPARDEDASSVIQIHFDAVHITAAKDYESGILDEWSPPVSQERINKFLNNGADVKLVAEMHNKVVGFGELLLEQNQLGAVYVSPSASGRGVGKALMMSLEKIAKERGVNFLQMESSVTAEKFYQKNGFKSIKHGVHKLNNGLEMTCVNMRKDFEF